MEAPERALRRAAVRAGMATSVVNSQPWHLDLYPGRLDLSIDPARELAALDPRRRQLLLSMGCALFNARVALAATGMHAEVQRLPQPLSSQLVARLLISENDADWVEPIGGLDPAIDRIRILTGSFSPRLAPPHVVQRLVETAAAQGAELIAVDTDRERRAVARLSRQADAVQRQNPELIAELLRWVPEIARDPTYLDDEFVEPDWLPDASGAPGHQLVILCVEEDSPEGWLRGGEALQAVLLELAGRGYGAALRGRMFDVPAIRDAVRDELGIKSSPQLLLVIGNARAATRPRRRRLIETITEH